MGSDSDKSRTELLEEISQLKLKLAETNDLKNRLNRVESELDALQNEGIAEGDISLDGRYTDTREMIHALRMSQLIVERSPVILFRRAAGENPRLEYISENLRQFGYSPADFLDGKVTFKDIVHPDDVERVQAEVHQYGEEDVEEYTMVYRCVTRDGRVRWVEDQTSVVRDEVGKKIHNQGVLLDITERKLAEDALRKSEEKYRRIVETAGEGFVLMNGDLIITDVNDTYCQLIGHSREELIGLSIMDLATDDFRTYMQYNREELLAKEKRVFEGVGVTKDGIEVPLLVHGNTLRNDQGEVIGHMAFITDMTDHKKALMLAGEVQKSLLPQEKPVVKGLDIAGRNVSCDEIGGDYYDFIWQRNTQKGPFSVAVGDISGHGVDSALLMTTARAFLRMRASQPGSISEIITAMNQHLAKDINDSGRFMTLFFLSLDPVAKTMDWVRAGHDPALLYDSHSGTFEELKGSGIALGVVDEFHYEEQRRYGLQNGQILAIGTDGIWESFNKKGEMFGKDRLRAVIRREGQNSAAEILNAVYEDLNQFTIGQKFGDDITLVIIKVEGLEE